MAANVFPLFAIGVQGPLSDRYYRRRDFPLGPEDSDRLASRLVADGRRGGHAPRVNRPASAASAHGLQPGGYFGAGALGRAPTK